MLLIKRWSLYQNVESRRINSAPSRVQRNLNGASQLSRIDSIHIDPPFVACHQQVVSTWMHIEGGHLPFIDHEGHQRSAIELVPLYF